MEKSVGHEIKFFCDILQQPLSSEDSEAVNHSLLLIRNILHAPERPPSPSKMSANNEDKASNQQSAGGAAGNSQTPYLGPHSHSHGFTADCSQQNRLLWNLFAQGLDRLLINLLASSQKVLITLQITAAQGVSFSAVSNRLQFDTRIDTEYAPYYNSSMLLSLGIRESGKLVFSLCLSVFFRVLRTFGIGLKLSGINFVASLEAKTE